MLSIQRKIIFIMYIIFDSPEMEFGYEWKSYKLKFTYLETLLHIIF
jgi:hypothetical protein